MAKIIVKATMIGDKTVIAALANMSTRWGKLAMSKGLREAALIVRREVKSSAPVRTGRMRRSVTMKKIRRKRGDKNEAAAYVVRSKAPYSNPVQTGRRALGRADRNPYISRATVSASGEAQKAAQRTTTAWVITYWAILNKSFTPVITGGP